MGEEIEKIDDKDMFDGYALFLKFLKNKKKLTEAEKYELRDMGITL